MLTAECSLSKEVNYVRRIAYKICSSLSLSSTRFFILTENLLAFAPVFWEWQFRPFLQDSCRLLIFACLQPNIPESVDTIIFIISKSRAESSLIDFCNIIHQLSMVTSMIMLSGLWARGFFNQRS